MNQTGFFISLEGIDGCGKSTLAKKLASNLKDLGHEVILTKEPGGSELGRQLREILHTKKEHVNDTAEFLLFAADRAQHIQSIVKPALEQGKVVISDRLHDSSLAYQGFGRGLDTTMITSINKWVMGQISPDLTFYLTIDVHTALDRLKKRNLEPTSFEKEKIDFWERVTTGYETIFKNCSHVQRLDGTQSPATLAARATELVAEKI